MRVEQKSVISRDVYVQLVDKLIQNQSYLVLETHFEKGQIPRIKRHDTLVSEDVKRIIEQ